MARFIIASIVLSLIFVIESSALNYKFGSRVDGKRNEILKLKKRNIFSFKSSKFSGDHLIRIDSPPNEHNKLLLELYIYCRRWYFDFLCRVRCLSGKKNWKKIFHFIELTYSSLTFDNRAQSLVQRL